MMFRELIGPIDGAGVYQLVALFLFLGAFIVLAVRGFRMDRKIVNRLKRLPLDAEPETTKGEETSA